MGNKSTANTVDIEEASFCAFLSALAYAPKNVIQDTANILNYEYVDLQGEGFFFIHGNFAYIVFKGTDNPKDFVTDGKFFKVSRSYGRIHKGFADQFETLKDLISDTIKEKQIDEATCVGHSLGAAACVLCSYYLGSSTAVKVRAVYTYGQPRIGNWRWKRNYKKLNFNHYRFVDNQDLVAKVPRLFYHHVGKPFYITQSAEIILKDPRGWRKYFTVPFVGGINDHKIFRRYFLRICSHLEKPFMDNNLLDICRILKTL